MKKCIKCGKYKLKFSGCTCPEHSMYEEDGVRFSEVLQEELDKAGLLK